ncbi:MAG: beta strand repeat-containing protein [Opitutales bacterium]
MATPSRTLRNAFLVAAAALLGASKGSAEDIQKDNDLDALNLGTSWVGGTVPSGTDMVIFDSLYDNGATGTSINYGAALSVSGMTFGAMSGTAGQTLTLGADATQYQLTLGSGGINAANSTMNIVLGSKVNVAANQIWTVMGGNFIRIGSAAGTGVLTGSSDITLAQSGAGTATVDFNVSATGLTGYSGSIYVGANVLARTSQSTSSNYASWGTGRVYLDGGTVGTGGMLDATKGNWTWNTDMVLLSTGGTIDNTNMSGSGRTLTLNSGITGSGGLTFKNSGGASLSLVNVVAAGNSYTGGTTINADAQVRLGNGGVLGSLGSGTITINSTTNPALSLARTGVFYLGNTITGSGRLDISNSSGTGSGLNFITGSNTYSGITAIYGNAGTYASVGSLSTTSGNLGSGAIYFVGGSLIYTGATDTITRGITWGAVNGSALYANGTGALIWNPGSAIGSNSSTSARTFIFGGTNTGLNTFGGSNAVIPNFTGTTSFTKTNVGTWVLNQLQTYTGTTTIAGGTLRLDFVNATAGIIKSGNGLTFSGTGTLELFGKSATTSAQTLGTITLTAGNATLLNSLNDASGLTLTAGTLSRSAGATLVFDSTSGGSIGVTNTASNGIVGPWAFIKTAANTFDYAVPGASNAAAVTALASSTALPTSGGGSSAANYASALSGTAITLGANTAANTIRLTSHTAGASLALSTFNLTTAGLLLTGANTGATTISGTGVLGNTTGEFVLNNSSGSTLTVTSRLINASATSIAGSLTKTGAGTVIINSVSGASGTANSNAFSGAVSVNQGELQSLATTPGTTTALAAGTYSPFGTGTITVNPGATLRFKTGSTSNAYTYANTINLRDATLISDDGVNTFSGNINSTGWSEIRTVWSSKTATFSGIISGSGFIDLTAPGNISFTNAANTFTGFYTLKSGTLVLGGANTSLGAAAGLIVNAGATASWDRGTNGSSNLFTNTTTSVVSLAGSSVSTATLNITQTVGGAGTFTRNIPKLVLNYGTVTGTSTLGNSTIKLNGAVEVIAGTTNTIRATNGTYHRTILLDGEVSGSGSLTLNRGNLPRAGFSSWIGFRNNAVGYSGNISLSTSTATNGYYFFGGAGGWGSGTLTLLGSGSDTVLGDATGGVGQAPGAITSGIGTQASGAGAYGSIMNIQGSATLNSGSVMQLLNSSSTAYIGGAEIAGTVTLQNATLGLYGTYLSGASAPAYIPYTNATWVVSGTGLSTVSAALAINYAGTGFDVGDAVAGAGTDLLVSGVIRGSQQLGKSGDGTMALTAANTTTGGFNVTAGTLNVGNGGATGDLGTGTTAIGASGTVALNHSTNFSLSNAFTGAGTISKVNGTAVETLTGSLSGFTGTIAVAAGSSAGAPNVLALGSSTNTDASSTITVAQYAALRSTGTSTVGNVTLASGGNLQVLVDLPDQPSFFFTAGGTVAFAAGSGIVVANTAAIDPGTYRLISYGSGAITYNGSALADGILASGGLAVTGLAPSRNVFTLTNDATNKTLDMTVTGVAANLVWNGTFSTWDATQGGGVGTAWNNSDNAGAADWFYNFDHVTLDDSVGATPQTITLAGTLTPGSLTVSGSTDYTLDGTGSLSGTANIVKGGSGTLTLSNTAANALSGTITVNGGKLAVTSAYTMSTGGLILNDGATFAATDAAKTVGRNLTINGSVGLGDAAASANALTFSATNSIAESASVTGAVALSFTGTNTFGAGSSVSSSGAITLSGTNVIGNGVSFTAGSASTISSLGTTTPTSLTLAGDGAWTVSGGVALAGNTTLTVNGGGTTLSGIVSGASRALIKEGTGKLTLNGVNTNSGGVTVNAGTVQLGTNNANTTAVVAGAINIASGATFIWARQNANLTNTLTGSGTYQYQGGGVPANNNQVISGATGFGGTWLIKGSDSAGAGYLGFASDAAMGSGSNFTLDGGGFYFTGGGNTMASTRTITLLSGGGFFNGSTSNSNTIASTITGSGLLTKVSGETQTFTGNNDYSGGTLLKTGTIIAGSNTALGVGTVTVSDGTSNPFLQFADGVTVANAFSLGASAGTASRGMVEVKGTATGGTSGLVTITATPTAGTHFDTDSGSTLRLLGGISSASVPVTLGDGNFVLGGGGSYSALSMVSGSLKLGSANGLASGATLTLGSGAAATLDLNGYSQSNAVTLTAGASGLTLTNTGDVASINLANTGTIDYNIAGTTAIALSGAGAKVLTGANTHSGGTTVTAGSLDITAASVLGSGGLTLNGGSFSLTQATAATLTGALAGSSTFTKAGDGSLALAGGAASFTGLLNVNAGSVAISGTTLGGSGSGSLLTIADGATASGSFSTARDIRVMGSADGVSSGAVIRASNTLTPGTMTVTGVLEFGYADELGGAGVSRLNTVIGDSTADLIDVTGGTLKLLGDVNVAFLNGGFGSGTYDILTFDLASLDNNLTGNFFVAGTYGHTEITLNTDALSADYWQTTGALTATVTKANLIWVGDGVGNDVDGTNTNFKLSTDDSASALLAGDELLFNDTSSNRTVNLASGVPALGKITVNTDLGYTISGSGALTGDTAQLVKEGTGTLTLGGANTFGGGVHLDGGTLAVASDGALGASNGVVSLGAGTTLRATGSFTLAATRAVTLEGNATISADSAATLTYDGSIGGAYGLTKAGNGTLSLGGVNTYTGGTTVSAGTLQLTASNALAASGALTVSNGTLDIGSTTQTVGALTLSGGSVTSTGTINASSVNVSGGTLAGTVTTLATASLSGGTVNGTLTAGTLSVASGTLDGTGTINASNYSLSAGTLGSGLTLGGAAALTKSADGVLTLNARLTNTGGVAVSGGTLALTNANTYTGGTTLSGNGILQVGNAGALGAASATLTLNGGTISSNSTTGYTVTAAGASTIGGDVTFGDATNTGALTLTNAFGLGGATRTLTVATGSTATLSGIISNGALVKSGTGTLNLNAANTYNGGLTVSAGTVATTNAQGLGATTNAVTLSPDSDDASILINYFTTTVHNITVSGTGAGTATLGSLYSASSGQNTQYSGTITLGRDVTLMNNTSDRTTFAGKISGTGNITISSINTAGRVTFTQSTIGAANDFVGDIILGASSQLQLGTGTNTNNFAIPDASSIYFTNAGSYLRLSGGNASAETVNALISNSAGAGLIQATENAGTLTIGAGNGSGTFSGVIGHNGTHTLNIVKAGSGNQTLSGTNTFIGTTTLTGGTLTLASTGALSMSTLTLNGGAGSLVFDSSVSTFNVGGLSGTSSGSGYDLALEDNAVTPAGITLSVGGNNSNTTYAGVLSGAGSLIKTGTGTLILTGTNLHTGGTTLDKGGLTITTTDQLGSGAFAATYGGTSTLTIANNDQVTFGKDISLGAAASATTFNIVKNSASASTGTILDFTGTITGGGANNTLLLNASTTSDTSTVFRFAGDNSFVSAITLNRGAISLASATGLGAATNAVKLDPSSNTVDGSLRFESSMTVANPFALTFATTGINTYAYDVTLTGAISGNQTLHKLGSGSLTLTGAGSSTGGLTVANGTVILGGGNNRLGASAATLTIGAASTSGKLVLGNDTSAANQAFTGLTSTGLAGSIVGGNASVSTLSITTTATQTYAGILGGSGTNEDKLAFSKAGSGDLTLSGNNNYTGGTTLAAGTLRVAGYDNVLGGGDLAVTGSSTLATASGGGARTLANNINANTGLTLTLDASAANLRLNGAISASGSSLTSGAASGTVTLGGTVTATNLNVNGSATVEVVDGADVTVSTVAGTATTGLNTLSVTGGQLKTSYFNLGNSTNNRAYVSQTGGTVTVLSGGAGFRIGHWNNNSTTLASTYTISGGTLDATALSANVDAAQKVINIGWDGLGAMVVGGGGSALVKAYGIQLDANGDSGTYNNKLTVSTNGTVEVGAGGIGAASTNDSLILSGGTLRGTATGTWAATGALSSATTNTFEANTGVTVTQSGALSGAGNLSKSGDGTVILSANNSYSGTTAVTAGTLQIGSGSTTGSIGDGNISIDSGATLAVNRSSSLTMANNFSGSGTLSYIGSSEVLLTGSNSFSGALNIQSGKIGLNSANANGGLASVTIASTGTLSIGDAYNGSTATIRNLSGSGKVDPQIGLAGTRTLAVEQTQDTTFSGLITDATSGAVRTLALNKTGNSTLTLSGASNAYTGGTTVSAGTLAFASGSLGSAGAVSVNGGTLRWSSGNTQDLSARLSGGASGATLDTGANDVSFASGVSFAGALTKAGSGDLTLTSAGSVSGLTTVSNGRLILGSASAIGSNGVFVDASGSLRINWGLSGDSTFANTITGTGIVDVATTGTGTFTLSGLSGFSGGTLKLSSGVFDAASSAWTGDIIFAGGTLLGGLSGYTGEVTVSNGSTLSVADGLPSNLVLSTGGTLDFTGVTDSNITIQFAGGSLSNASGFTGNVNVVGTGVNVGSGSIGGGTLVLGAGSSVNITGTLSNAVTVSGGSIQGGTNLIGNITVSSGSFMIGAPSGTVGIDALSSTATVSVAGGALNLNGGAATNEINFSSGSITNGSSFAGTLYIQAATNGSGVVAGTGTLTNAGGSTLGGTIVVKDTGVLRNNGTVTGEVTVESGGTLSGSGAFTAVTVQQGGILSPGNSPGVQTYTGNLVLSGGSIWVQQIYSEQAVLTAGDHNGQNINARGYDTIALTDDGIGFATLDLSAAEFNPITLRLMTLTNWSDSSGGVPTGGNLTFTRDGLGEWIPKDFIIATYTGGAILGGDLNISSYFAFDTSDFYFATGPRASAGDFAIFEHLNTESGLTELTLRVVPEPSTYGLILGGLALAGAAIRRRRRQAK